MKTIITKIIAGSPTRKTRFHDDKGNLVPFYNFLAPLKIVPRRLLIGLGIYPELPLWPIPIINHFNQTIKHDWKILEFGSGFSTIWLANRCGYITSIEENSEWYIRIKEVVKQRKLNNVDIQLRNWSIFPSVDEIPEMSLDLVVVDSLARDQFVVNSLSKIKIGGYIYLDDADKSAEVYRRAEKTLWDLVNAGRGEIKCFTGFQAHNLWAQGILFQLNN